MAFEARALRIVALSALAGCSTACATVTRGSNTSWAVKTTPVGARVATSHGMSCEPTPCAIKMPRKSRFTAVITKPGYKAAEVSVTNRMSSGGGAGMAGNVLVGGFIGAGVDVASGAMLDLTPNPTIVVLERETMSGAAVAVAAYAPSPVAVVTPAATLPVPVPAHVAAQPAPPAAVETVAARAAATPIPQRAPVPGRPAEQAFAAAVHAPLPVKPARWTAPLAPRPPAGMADLTGGVRVRTVRVLTPSGGFATIETFEPSSGSEP